MTRDRAPGSRRVSLVHRMILIAAVALTVSAGSALGRPADDPSSCTHGASSIGPVALAEDAAPPAATTEACLP